MEIKTAQELAEEVAVAEVAEKAANGNETANEGEPEVSLETNEFSEFNDSFDKEETPEDAVPVVEETPEAIVEETEEVIPVEVPTPVAEVVEITPVVAPMSPEPVAIKPVEQTEEEKVLVKAQRDKAEETLISAFKLSEEDEEKFLTSPNEVLPKMAANMYLDIFNSLTQVMHTQLPQLVQNVISQNSAREASRSAFNDAWPQLAKPEFAGIVERIASTYNTNNPSATPEEAIAEIGAQVWVAAKLPIQDLAAHVSGKPEVPVAVPTITPQHRPASVGNAPRRAKAPVMRGVQNQFTDFAEELILDDEG